MENPTTRPIRTTFKIKLNLKIVESETQLSKTHFESSWNREKRTNINEVDCCCWCCATQHKVSTAEVLLMMMMMMMTVGLCC